MKLFHQLDDQDQHNAIHYCIHLTIDDFLEDGVDLEVNSEEDQKLKDILEKVLKETEKLDNEPEKFEFIMKSEAGDIVFEMALNMAKEAYYHSNDELAIHYEDLRSDHNHDEEDTGDEEIATETNKNNKHNLN